MLIPNFSSPSRAILLTRLTISLLLMFLLFGCSVFAPNKPSGFSSLAKQADQARKAGDCDKAIPLYREHLHRRLKDSKRPKSENPWFYLILIGDCLVDQDKEDVAVSVYLEAKEKKVLPELVADRFIRISERMTSNNRFSEAMRFLKKHREIDELLFDARIDEIHKRMVAMEEFPVKEVEPLNSKNLTDQS